MMKKLLTGIYEDNISAIENILTDCPDILRKKVLLSDGKEGCFFYIHEIANIDLVERDFINPIINLQSPDYNTLKSFCSRIPITGITYCNTIDDIIYNIMSGNTAFLSEGLNFGICCSLKKINKRDPIEPDTEKSVRGSHDGFIEDIDTNIAMVRMRIKSPHLKFKMFKLGSSTNQTLSIAYLKNIANENLLKILSNKIDKIEMDGLIGIGFIEQLITDHPNSIFPQYNVTERPDKIAAELLDGKFGIFLEGSPSVLIAPINFYSFIQTSDDYNINWLSGSFLRFLRTTCLFTSIFLPGFYIAIITYNYYMLPVELLVNIANSRARVPFPPIVEATFMELFVEMLREAAIRLPTYVGGIIGVVGGLIIGQSAVQAGIVSNQMVIVVSLTMISTFIIPVYNMNIALRIIRFLIMIAASLFGMVGIVISFLVLLSHLIVLDSLGQPYFQPIEPFKAGDMKDTLIRSHIGNLKKRPDIAKPKDKWRGYNHEHKNNK